MLFQKNPSRLLDSARANCNKLTARLTEAEESVNARRSAAKGLARNGADDAALDKAELQLRMAQDRVSTLTAALAETNAEVVQIEAELAAQLDAQLRAETAQLVESDAKELVEAAKLVDESATRLGKVASRISAYIIDAQGLTGFTEKVKQEIPPNISLLESVMRSFAAATLAGHGKPTLPAQVVTLEVPPQPAPTVREPVKPDPRISDPIKHAAFEVVPQQRAPRSIAIPAAASRSNPTKE
jgi:hypothetical protein